MATATPGSPPPLLDLRTFDRLRQLDQGAGAALGRLVALFEEHAPRVLAELHAAADRQDAAVVERLVHSLKSSAGSLGTRRLMQLCGVIEERAGAGDLAAATARLDELRESIAAARAALRAALAAPPAP
jgi:HPt (histidine-containing phosphotransfer) domain-containing protein